MDLGEKDVTCDYEKVHRLIENTYRNILKNFNPGVKQLIVLGKALQKTIQNVGTSFKAYNECLFELARSAEASVGSTKELGLGLLQFTDCQNELNQQLLDSIKVFHAELLIPLKAKQESEFRHVQKVQLDKYVAGYKYHSNNLRKAQVVLEKCKKKQKSKSGQKEIERTRQWKECKRKLEEYLHKNLRLALLEERKRYCYFFNRLMCVAEDKLTKSNKSNERLTDGLRTWTELCRIPHKLPPSTEQIIRDFGFSDDICGIEEEPSGEGEHGGARRGTSASLNPHDLQPEPRHEFGRPTKRAVSAGAADLDKKHSAIITASTPAFDSKVITSTESPEVKRFAPTPTMLCAIHPYTAVTETQLSLETNDVIRIVGDVQNGWLYGHNTRTNKEGWFPVSFTDFNDEHLQANSSQPGFRFNDSQPQNTVTLHRATWHPDTKRGDAVTPVSSSDVTVTAQKEVAKIDGSMTLPATRPMSYCTTTVTTEIVELGNTTRYKFANRRILSLEPISEQIPPPDQFRDPIQQVTVRTITAPERPKSASPKPPREGAKETGNEITREQGQRIEAPREHCPFASKGCDAGNQSDAADGFKDQGGGGGSGARSSPYRQVNVEVSLPVWLPSSPTSPSPPPPASTTVSRSPQLMSVPIYATPSPLSRSGVNHPNPVLSKQSVELNDAQHASSPPHGTGDPPLPPPPPPPPPLPPGSYHSVRSEGFARTRLRKSGSIESTKTT